MERSSPLRPGSTTLVTGGAGFIGSHLCGHLLAEGAAVHVLDDLSAGSLANLRPFGTRPDLRVTVADAADPARVKAAMADACAVFHLAGAVGVRRLMEEQVSVLERNLRPTEVVLAAAAERGIPVLLASSSEVYGDGPVPFREADPVRPGPTDAPRGGYACAKAMGEWLGLAYARERRLPVVVARIFNCVGERQSARHGMVLPRFLAQARAGEPITVYGDGSQTRCFAWVGDTVRALCELLGRPAAAGAVWNVGSDQEIAIRDLAVLVREALGSSSAIVHQPFEDVFPGGLQDPPRRVPCLEKLRGLLGWVPDVPVEEVVARMTSVAARPVVA